MELKKKRELAAVLRGLIGEGFSGTQAQMGNELRKRGFSVTQATISRMLKKLGAAKEFRDGRPIYRTIERNRPSYRGSLGDLVRAITNNENLAVVKTAPASAMFVAGFIDHECDDLILGTVAGDDTIIIVPKRSSALRVLVARIQSLLE